MDKSCPCSEVALSPCHLLKNAHDMVGESNVESLRKSARTQCLPTFLSPEPTLSFLRKTVRCYLCMIISNPLAEVAGLTFPFSVGINVFIINWIIG